MTLNEVTTILRNFNKWRRGNENIPQLDAREIGKAIDAAIETIERLERVEAALRALKADPWPTIINGMITPAHISRPTVADPDFDQEEADALTEYLQQGLK